MLQFVVGEPGPRQRLSSIPLRLLLTREPTKAEEVLAADVHLHQFKCESLMFDAG